MRAIQIFILISALISAACRPAAKPESKQPQIGWRPIGSFSGHGDAQLESFESTSGQLRFKWETTHEASPGAGKFRLMVHSAVSGRPLALAVEHQGTGRDTAYVNEDPRLFHLVVESSGVDWSFKVEEAVVNDK